MAVQTIVTNGGTISITNGVAGNAPTLLTFANASPREAYIINEDTAVIKLGDGTVTTSTGIPVGPNYGRFYFLNRGTNPNAARTGWYAISASGTAKYTLIELA